MCVCVYYYSVDDNNKTGISVQAQIDKFSIIQSGTASSMLYHIENFIKTEVSCFFLSIHLSIICLKVRLLQCIITSVQATKCHYNTSLSLTQKNNTLSSLCQIAKMQRPSQAGMLIPDE